ncbi:hypothetical protein HDU97_004478 [Phlyctochytrium planicorne]|nr:hypothetical protein HDU97_004478 [Phlyctochytrium planicorne]
MARWTFFDFLLPGFILDHTESLMFPMPWHIRFNYIWFIQCSIIYIWCIRNRIWIPQRGTTFKPWAVKQFQFLLLSHGAFYVVELYVTNMFRAFTPMSIHHAVAILIFVSVYREPNSISVACITPFLVHAFYWSCGATSDELLYTYNWLLLLCGITGIHQYFLELDPKYRIISPVLPLSVLVVSWTNYFTYCHSYFGTMCWKPYLLSDGTDPIYKAKMDKAAAEFLKLYNPTNSTESLTDLVANITTAIDKDEIPEDDGIAPTWRVMVAKLANHLVPKGPVVSFSVTAIGGFCLTLLLTWYVATRISRPIVARWRKARHGAAGMESGFSKQREQSTVSLSRWWWDREGGMGWGRGKPGQFPDVDGAMGKKDEERTLFIEDPSAVFVEGGSDAMRSLVFSKKMADVEEDDDGYFERGRSRRKMRRGSFADSFTSSGSTPSGPSSPRSTTSRTSNVVL